MPALKKQTLLEDKETIINIVERYAQAVIK